MIKLDIKAIDTLISSIKGDGSSIFTDSMSLRHYDTEFIYVIGSYVMRENSHYIYLVDTRAIRFIGHPLETRGDINSIYFGLDINEEIEGTLNIKFPTYKSTYNSYDYIVIYLDRWEFLGYERLNDGYCEYMEDLIGSIGLYGRLMQVKYESFSRRLPNKKSLFRDIDRSIRDLRTHIESLLNQYPYDSLS